MKKSRSFIALIVFASMLALVGSCEEHDEKMEVKYEPGSHASGKENNSNLSNGQVGTAIYDGTVGDPIDFDVARRWAANYRNGLEKADDRLAHYFGADIIQQILGQSNCVGMRIYYGIDDDGNKVLMLIGVDAKGENLIPMPGAKAGDEGNIIGDASFPCPNTCPENDL